MCLLPSNSQQLVSYWVFIWLFFPQRPWLPEEPGTRNRRKRTSLQLQGRCLKAGGWCGQKRSPLLNSFLLSGRQRRRDLPKQRRTMTHKMKVKVKSLSRVWLFATPWTVAYQAPLSMGFSRQGYRQEYWSGLPFPSPGDLPNPGIEPRSPALPADALPPEPPGKTQELTDNPEWVISSSFQDNLRK